MFETKFVNENEKCQCQTHLGHEVWNNVSKNDQSVTIEGTVRNGVKEISYIKSQDIRLKKSRR